MPFRPAASRTAKARYGLAALSSERNSMRVLLPLDGLYIGTRISDERLLCPQQIHAGASAPPASRLYEFTHWLVTAVISGACTRSPAMNERATLRQLVLGAGLEEGVAVALEQRQVRVHAGARAGRAAAWA